jgi:small subunit ribosomal protein S6
MIMDTIRNYETVFIINPATPETRLKDLNAKTQQIIESFKGKVLHLDDWGKRKMAYAINKEPKGHYLCLTYTANNQCVAEIERNMRINEDIMRFLTVKIDDKVDPMAAIAAFKRRQEAHVKREKERAEHDAERAAARAERSERFDRARPRFNDGGPGDSNTDRGE